MVESQHYRDIARQKNMNTGSGFLRL